MQPTPKLSLKSRRPSSVRRVVAITSRSSSSPSPCFPVLARGSESESDVLLESTTSTPAESDPSTRAPAPVVSTIAAAAVGAVTAESSVETIPLEDSEVHDAKEDCDGGADHDDNGGILGECGNSSRRNGCLADKRREDDGVAGTTASNAAVRANLSTPPETIARATDAAVTGMACCPVCREPFAASQDSPARARHVNTHFASPSSASTETAGPATAGRGVSLLASPCKVCRRDLSDMSLEEKVVHVNECLDAAENLPSKRKSNAPREECPMCHATLPRTNVPRMAHLKRCASSHGVSAAQLITLVRGHLPHVALDDEWRSPGE